MSMTSEERRSVGGLSTIFALRMMGLFLILPVFSTYAHGLDGALEHPELVGIALGAYGLTQALFQIPFGMMSDKIGRKPVIAAGMVIFAIGSVIAATSDGIIGVLIGRIIQGSGAVAAAVIALTADLTSEENRTKAMASIGLTIGASFAVSMALAPILNHWVGVQGIFGLTAVLSLLSILVLYFVVPEPDKTHHHSDSGVSSNLVSMVLKHKQLQKLDFGVFVLHASLTAMFVVLPLVLMRPDHVMMASEDQWKLYVSVMVLAFVFMVPLIIIAEAKRKMKQIFLLSIGLLITACLLLAMTYDSFWMVATALLLFFVGFNTLEASLPSLISKYAPAGTKGTAIGVFNTSQFFGAFVGGALGGFLYQPEAQNYGLVFWVVAAMLVAWWIVALFMEQPPYLSTVVLRAEVNSDEEAKSVEAKLLALQGVEEAVVVPAEQVAYCKVDKKVFDKDAMQAVLQ